MKRVITCSTSNTHVIDLCCVNESDMVQNQSPLDIIGSWKDYYERLCIGSLDGVWFDLDDIDQSLFIIDDGGEMIRLKDGSFVNIVFRGDQCRMFEEDDDEQIDYIQELLQTWG